MSVDFYGAWSRQVEIEMYTVTSNQIPQHPTPNTQWVEDIVKEIREAGETQFIISAETKRTHPMFARGTLGQSIEKMIRDRLRS